MSVLRGSYRYDSFQEKTQTKEFERLYHQASTPLDIERQIWPSLGIAAGKKVLDVGCGSGVITRELAKQAYPAQVVGLDASTDLLERGKDAYTESIRRREDHPNRENVTFQEGNVYDIPFPDDSFDVVYARLLFQHLENPLEALSSIWRVLKPGGCVCILDVDKDWSSLYPEPKTSAAIDKAIVEKQLAQGGDPWVGRKLGYYLSSSHFTQVRTTITLIDSDRLGLANFFGMLSFGGAYHAEKSAFSSLQQEARRDVQVLIESPYAWAGFGLFVATGCKE